MNRQDEILYCRGLVDGILLGHCVDWIRREPERFLFELGYKEKMKYTSTGGNGIKLVIWVIG